MTKSPPKESPVTKEAPKKVLSYAQKANQVAQKSGATSNKNTSHNSVKSLNNTKDIHKVVENLGDNGPKFPKPTRPIESSLSKFNFLSLEQNAGQENLGKSFSVINITFGDDIKVLSDKLELNQNVNISALYLDKKAGLVPFKGIQVHIPGILCKSKLDQKTEPSSSPISEKAPSSISSLFSLSKISSIDKIPEFIPKGFSAGKLPTNTLSSQPKPKTISNNLPDTSNCEPVLPHASAETQKCPLPKPVISETTSSSLSLGGKPGLEKEVASSNSATPSSEASSLIGANSAKPLTLRKSEKGGNPLEQIKPFVPKNFVPSYISPSVSAPYFSPFLNTINGLPFTLPKPITPVKIIDPNTKTEVVFENKTVKKETAAENLNDAKNSQLDPTKVSEFKQDDSLGKDCTSIAASSVIGSKPECLDSDCKPSMILEQEVVLEPISHEPTGNSHSAPASTRVSSPGSPGSSDFSEPSDIKESLEDEAGLSPARVCYDRSFLLQFKNKCLSKPANFQDAGLTQGDANPDRTHGHRSSRSSSFGGSKLKTSEERFKASTIQMRSGGSLKGSHNRSNGESNRKSHNSFSGSRSNSHHSSTLDLNSSIPLEPVEPLKPTENRWTPSKADEEDKQVRINKKIKSLLNKLTLEKFDSISDQIIGLANESEQEKDGETLKLVIKNIFEKATDEPNFSAVYAQLCAKLQSELSSKIIDQDLKNKDGEYYTGGIVFRKYLLTRCQHEFEKGWKDNVATELQSNFDLMSDEYYKVAKAKRQGLGLIRFIGELFKLSMLTEAIMHNCIKGMLQKEPDEEEVESLCKLMSTIGKQIDTRTSSQQMKAYFMKIAKMSLDENLPIRSRFALKNLMDLRKDKWEQKRGDAAGPKTLQEIREDAELEAEEKQRLEKQRRTTGTTGTTGSLNRSQSVSLPRETSRDRPRLKDGWNTVNGNSLTRGKTADNSPSDKLSKDGFTQKKPVPTSIANKFTMLNDADITPDVATRPKFKLLPRSKVVLPSDSNSDQVEMTQHPDSDTSANEAFNRKVINTVKEFWALGDFEEALLSIKELSSSDRNGDVVDVFISEAIERKPADVARLAELFNQTADQNVISSEDFFSGAKKTAAKLDDISLDAPAAFDHMAMLLDAYSLDLSDLLLLAESMITEPNSFPPGPRLFSAMIKHRRVSESEDALIEEFLAKQCDLTRLYHKDDLTSDSLIKLSKNPVLTFLLPSITSADWWKSLIPDTL